MLPEGFCPLRFIKGQMNERRKIPPQPMENESMKTLNHLLVTAAAAVMFTLSAQAGDALLSPRAKDLQPHIAPSSSVNDANLTADRPAENAKAWTIARSLQIIPSTASEIDLANAPRPTLSPKDARYEVALRNNAVREFQVASLK